MAGYATQPGCSREPLRRAIALGVADGTSQDVLGDLVALGFDQADQNVRAPQRVSAPAYQRGMRGGLFGQIARNGNRTCRERPAGDKGAQQALGGRQGGQAAEAFGFVFEPDRQVGVLAAGHPVAPPRAAARAHDRAGGPPRPHAHTG